MSRPESPSYAPLPSIRNTILAIAALCCWNFLFWRQAYGINFSLVWLLAIGLLSIAKPVSWLDRRVLLCGLAGFTAAIACAIHGSPLARWALTGFGFLQAGFALSPELRAIPVVMTRALAQPFISIRESAQSIRSNIRDRGALAGLPSFHLHREWLTIAFFPMVITGMFFSIYSFANPHFSSTVSQWWIRAMEGIRQIFQNFSIEWISFMLLGLAIALIFLSRSDWRGLSRWEMLIPEKLRRRRRSHAPRMDFDTMDLRREYRMGMSTLIMVNLLIFFYLIIDYRFLFKADSISGAELKAMVYESTGGLILSILLAMALLLYFFRGNLNFYPDQRRRLQKLAYIWIGSNAILAVSLIIRNMLYIQSNGLAYKRLGIFFWLVLVAAGLWTFWKKIDRRKSAFWLVKSNAICAVILLAVSAPVDWDRIILKVNLNHTSGIQQPVFLLDMPDRLLPTLWENHPELYRMRDEDYPEYAKLPKYSGPVLEGRVMGFIADKDSESWPSWTLREAQARKYFAELPQFQSSSHN